MAQEELIAKRYAKGLAEYAVATGKVAEVQADLSHLSDLIDPHSGDFSVPKFLDFLNTPVVTPEAKLEVTDVILAKIGAGKTVSDFLNILIEKNRIGLIPQINRQFHLIAAELTNEHVATVFTAQALTDSQAERLGEALEQALSAKIRILQRVEPGLLAGARIEVDGHVIDGTVLGKLEALRKRMIKA